jgi:hypothetical protein
MSTIEASPPSRQSQGATGVGLGRLTFITVLDPSESKLPSQRKTVRSHAALYQATQERVAHQNQVPKKRHRKRKRKAGFPGESIILDTDLAQKTRFQHEGREILRPAELQGLIAHQVSYRSIGLLGAGRVDPFRTYPVPWEPFIPELVDHCSYLSCFLVEVSNVKADLAN